MVESEPTNLSVRCSGAKLWLIHVFRWMLGGCLGVLGVCYGVARQLLRSSGWLLWCY